RDVWRFVAIEDAFADVRFAIRQLRKSPAFALAGILTLALGIGGNTTVFSVVNAVILRPLPYPESDRLVSVQSRDIRGTPHPTDLSYPTFFDFRAENNVFEHIVSYRDSEFTADRNRPAHPSSRPDRLVGSVPDAPWRDGRRLASLGPLGPWTPSVGI